MIDARTGTAALKWLGSANVQQLGRLLEDGERAIAAGGADDAERALGKADRANGEGRTADAIAAYREALAKAAPGWERRPRAIESLVYALEGADDRDGCARAAVELVPGLPRGPSFANAALMGTFCALEADPAAPWRAGALAALSPLVEEAVRLPELLADDRSGAYELLVELRKDRGDEAGAKALAAQWASFLEREAQAAPTPEARAAFDAHRLGAALALGDPARAIPALEQSEKDLPGDYNPPARLALAYKELGRLDDALAAAERALAKVYGPRRLRVLDTKAQILVARGDVAGARAVLEEALRLASALPKGQQPERHAKRLRAALEKLQAGSTPPGAR